ncbi:MAG: YgiT-type zinc finger protein [Anaerolineae bacterium]
MCPYCSVGQLRRRSATFVWMFGQTLITVPNTPATECDVCHRREFDVEIVQHIEALVIPSGPPPNRYQPSSTTALTAASKRIPTTAPVRQTATSPRARSPKPKARPKG